MAHAQLTGLAFAPFKKFSNAIKAREDLAYLAGLVDGEGCFAASLSRCSARGAQIQLGMRLIISNNHREVLLWCSKIIGAGVIVRRAPTARQREHWRYVLEGNSSLLQLVENLLPFLKIKPEQASLMAAFLASRKHRARAPFNEEEIRLFYELRKCTKRNRGNGVSFNKKEYSLKELQALVATGRTDRYRVVEWTPSMDAVLGTEVDKLIADKLGLKLAQVQRRRTLLGKPSAGYVSAAEYAKVLQLHKSSYSNEHIATALGLGTRTVRRIVARG